MENTVTVEGETWSETSYARKVKAHPTFPSKRAGGPRWLKLRVTDAESGRQRIVLGLPPAEAVQLARYILAELAE